MLPSSGEFSTQFTAVTSEILLVTSTLRYIHKHAYFTVTVIKIKLQTDLNSKQLAALVVMYI